MPTPSYRVPVRVARGTKAALDAGIADLQEGEICYATDENALYVIEGGVLTPASADPTNVEIVNDTTPQLGGNLDTNTFQIISTAAGNIQIAPDTTGVLEVMGNAGNDAVIKLNCETNTHGIKLKSPPHSAAADYTLVFPNDTGSNGQALTTDGAGVMSWTTPSTVGSINDLTDVDTTTAAPTDGQALVWNNGDGEWVPGSVAADLGSTSIDALQDVDTATTPPTNDQVLAWNGTNWVPATQTGGGGGAVTSIIAGTGISADQATGDVTLTVTGEGIDLEGLENVASQTGTVSAAFYDAAPAGSYPVVGETGTFKASGGSLYLALTATSGDSLSSQGFVAGSGPGTFYVSIDGGSYQPMPYNETYEITDFYQFGSLSGGDTTLLFYASTINVALAAPVGGIVATDGQVLTWVDANGQWEPADAPSGGGGGAVDSVNGETGVVSLGIQEMDDYYNPSEYVFDTFNASLNPNEPGQWHLQDPGFTNNLAFAKEDANGATTSSIKDLPIGSPVWLNGVEFTTDAAGGSFSTGGSVGSWYISITEDLSVLDTSGGLVITLEGPIVDGDFLQWSDADQKFKPAQPVDSIFDLSDVEKTPIAGTTVFFYDGGGCSVPTGNGSAWPNGTIRTNASTGLLSFSDFDADGEDFRSVVAAKVAAVGTPFPFWTSADGATNWTQYSSSGDPTTNSNRLDFTDTGFTDCSRPLYVTLEDPANETPVEDLLEGDVLAWSTAEQEFRPAQLPDATATRTLLGIGEYVDDATAGTGGVTSGAMYYNTTSSDYRLKS